MKKITYNFENEKDVQTEACLSNVQFIISFVNRYEELLNFIEEKGEVRIAEIQKNLKYGYGFCMHALDILIDNGFVEEEGGRYAFTGKKLDSVEEIYIQKLPYSEKDKFLSNLKEEELKQLLGGKR